MISTKQIAFVFLLEERFLAREHDKQQHWQMPQTAEEELPGAAAVCIPVEPKAEVGDVEVNRERNDRESPRGDVEHRSHH